MQAPTFEGFRLSPQQDHLWELQPTLHDPTYRAQGAVIIEGRLDAQVLRTALETLCERYEILHTTFRLQPDMTVPVQVVVADTTIDLSTARDLSQLDPKAQEQAIAAWLENARAQPLDLEQSPLLRAALLALDAERHTLLLALPALCADAVTLQLLVEELAATYAELTTQEQRDVEPLQYIDISEWQHELLEGAETQAGRDYWQQHAPTLSDQPLPFETRDPHAAGFDPRSIASALPAESYSALAAYARQHQVAIDEVLLACWMCLFWRLTGQTRQQIGIESAGRKYEELQSALGLFAKTIPLTCRIDPQASLTQLVARVRRTAHDVQLWEEYFAWHLVAPTSEQQRFCPLSFRFGEAPRPQHAAGVTFSLATTYACVDRFKLKLECVAAAAGLVTTLHYDARLFVAADMQRLLASFQQLVASALSTPDAPVKDLEILSADERRQILEDFNGARVPHAEIKLFHQLFEIQAARTPEHLAVLFHEQRLSYAELNARANQLAHYLLQQGVKRETPVLLCAERSAELLIGILGILKAGGVYVPLDANYPQDRLQWMLEDSGATLLVTQSALRERLPAHAATTILLDIDWESIRECASQNPDIAIDPEHLAYIMYTSGSTGYPKGVMISHGNLYPYILAMREMMGVTADDVQLHIASFAFAASVRQFMVPLIAGAALVIADAEQILHPVALFELIKQTGVTIMGVSPSYWRTCVEALKQLEPAARADLLGNRLRLLLSASEALLSDLPQTWRSFAHDVQLVHLFGQTETTGIVTSFPIPQLDDSAVRVVPVGTPLPNMELYLLDDHLRPVPIGIAGEVYIGGPSIGRGYWRRPELTAEKFIPHPLRDDPGARLYKTGDLAFFHADGTLEHLGRIDQQVKLRGFRIELGEVEATLSQHPGVVQAVVVARADVPGDSRLVAYVVPSHQTSDVGANTQTQPVDAADLQAFLQAKLPAHMMPSAFVLLEKLPLTPTGKLDRGALPAPDQPRQSQATFVAPRTPAEQIVAGIWADILKVEQVGAHTAFFALGGHSLLATQVMSRVRKTFNVELPLRTLFEAPTVAGLAASIEAAQQAATEQQVDPIVPVARDQALPLSFAQERLWFLEQFQPGTAAYNMVFALHLKGTVDVHALEQSLDEIVKRHEGLRTSFHSSAGRPTQVIAPAVSVAVPVVDLSALAPDQREPRVREVMAQEAQRPFDLAIAPLGRVLLIRLEPDQHLLLLTLHHIISDGWSTGVLIQELASLYTAFTTGYPHPESTRLPALPIQYADYAVWQRRQLQGETLQRQLDYWRAQLADVPVLQLPTDRPRPVMQTFRGAAQPIHIPRALSDALRSLSQDTDTTLFMTLLAAWQTLLMRYSRQEDICVGTYIANRNRYEVENLIGFFVNNLALRTNLGGNPSFRELLARVRDVCLEAYAHQSIPFEKLVEELQPPRDVRHTPWFQVVFVLQNAPREELELPGLMLSPLESERDVVDFDLILELFEGDDGLTGSLAYNLDLFDGATIARLLDHFSTLLAGIVTQPEQRIGSLPLLSSPEAEQLLRIGNHAASPDLPATTIHELIAGQAARQPAAIAVVCGTEQLTYGDLDARANQLAHYLRSQHAGPEMRVGICVERSPDMVVGVLGILKAGGAYVPLDPDYPAERLASMLEDSAVSILLTQERLSATLPSVTTQTICLDRDWPLIAQQPTSAPASESTPDQLAYVIYTSGSTGTAKGVMVSHRSLVSALQAWESAYQLSTLHAFLQMANPSFDVWIGDLVRALGSGGRLVICPRDVLLDPPALYRLMQQQQIDCAEFVPAVIRPLAHYLAEHNLRLEYMRLLIVGSDAWFVSEYQQIRDSCCTPATRLINSYGLTEATIDSTYFERTDMQLSPEWLVPIGRPLANTEVYVLDQLMQPVPVGVAGELFVGGVAVARGYLHRAALTADKFVPHPFSATAGARLYKTGDLARYLPDGNLELLGRIDQQIKLRGYRIELGEIEAVLQQHPAVQSCAVLLHDERLVAYVVAKEQKNKGTKEQGETEISPRLPQPRVPSGRRLGEVWGRGLGDEGLSSTVRAYLREQLPAHMIPSAFVLLPALPLTPNGKLDRRALEALGYDHSADEKTYTAPQTATEAQLAQIWAAVLGRERIGIHDNFFELGGHSLLATQVIVRMRETFQMDLPLRSLFEATTIAELADYLETLRWLHEDTPDQSYAVVPDREEGVL
ncbi:MAG TPA: amino acid adenylation domain-containing protein [Herpetosiphonaceae bacterium]